MRSNIDLSSFRFGRRCYFVYSLESDEREKREKSKEFISTSADKMKPPSPLAELTDIPGAD